MREAVALAKRPDPVTPEKDSNRVALENAIHAACRRIAPLWPLKNFVAVNPFLGFTQQPFATTCATLERVVRQRALMPRAFYKDALQSGIIDDASLQEALNYHSGQKGLPKDIATLKFEVDYEHDFTSTPRAVVTTIAEIIDRTSERDRQISLVGFMIDEISSFCASYFDEGQASWIMPVRNKAPYAAWRALIKHDRNAEAMGIRGFNQSVRALPIEAIDAIEVIVMKLGIPARALEDYFHRALFDIAGWAAYARYLGWNAELEGRTDDSLIELLAIRLAWGWGLFASREDAEFRQAWKIAMSEAQRLPQDQHLGHNPDLVVDLVLQEAYEISYRRKLVQKVQSAPRSNVASASRRPDVQAAFCIDVRSEVFRRSLETISPDVETIGFAGFFGFPIEYVPIGQTKGTAQCPVLLRPAFTVCEAVRGAGEMEAGKVLDTRLLRKSANKAWRSFKKSAVSSFSFVETLGLSFVGKIITDSFGMTRPVPSPNLDGLDADIGSRLGPSITADTVNGRPTGFTTDQRIAMAEAVLKAMSLTSNFAKIVLLAGHGSTTVNNPHASGLDCGACGGHTGEANARVAAAVLNDPEVRQGLAARAIPIPTDCWFLAALHDTTTDHVHLYDEALVPKALEGDVIRLKNALALASSLARLKRSPQLGLSKSTDIDSLIVARSHDWSEVRPEWGLAGNTAFIAAPRSHTRSLDLQGRVFLHSYEHQKDEEYKVLELIMTAPMIVASWINLQYFGSTVNNEAFGSGNKVLHNVVGQIGVLEGNAGDLRVGLPWQSVHDGQRFIHEPIRLNVFLAAPETAVDTILQRHTAVRDLVVNEWIFLHTIGDDGVIRQCVKPGVWNEARRRGSFGTDPIRQFVANQSTFLQSGPR